MTKVKKEVRLPEHITITTKTPKNALNFMDAAQEMQMAMFHPNKLACGPARHVTASAEAAKLQLDQTLGHKDDSPKQWVRIAEKLAAEQPNKKLPDNKTLKAIGI